MTAIPLQKAHFCIDCESITDSAKYCPNCGSLQNYPLASWLNRKSSQPTEKAA